MNRQIDPEHSQLLFNLQQKSLALRIRDEQARNKARLETERIIKMVSTPVAVPLGKPRKSRVVRKHTTGAKPFYLTVLEICNG